MTQEHDSNMETKLGLSSFLAQQREENGLKIEDVSGRAGISVDRLNKLEQNADDITLFEATELASLYYKRVGEFSSIQWNNKLNPTINEIRELESDGVFVKICPSPDLRTIADYEGLLNLMKVFNEDSR